MSDHTSDAADPEDALIKANFGSIFARLPRDRWLEIMIRGSDHYMFSDNAVLRSPLVMRALRMMGVVGIDGRRQIAVTAHFISTFFDVWLNGVQMIALHRWRKKCSITDLLAGLCWWHLLAPDANHQLNTM
jgi:hypothetical protein